MTMHQFRSARQIIIEFMATVADMEEQVGDAMEAGKQFEAGYKFADYALKMDRDLRELARLLEIDIPDLEEEETPGSKISADA